VLIALNDLNAWYVRAPAGVGIMIEAAILLAIAYVAYRLGQRLDQAPDVPAVAGVGLAATSGTSESPGEPPIEPPPADPPAGTAVVPPAEPPPDPPPAV
jgi:hypothetical protein